LAGFTDEVVVVVAIRVVIAAADYIWEAIIVEFLLAVAFYLGAT
jgi:hypothetical protein